MVLIDAPPGTSCSMIAAVRGSDFVILVTEPTPFGLNDLALAVETVRALGIPFGVVINRAGSGDDRVHEYCAAEGIDVLLEIPDDRRIAEAYARGRHWLTPSRIFVRSLLRWPRESRPWRPSVRDPGPRKVMFVLPIRASPRRSP